MEKAVAEGEGDGLHSGSFFIKDWEGRLRGQYKSWSVCRTEPQLLGPRGVACNSPQGNSQGQLL